MGNGLPQLPMMERRSTRFCIHGSWKHAIRMMTRTPRSCAKRMARARSGTGGLPCAQGLVNASVSTASLTLDG